MTQLTINGKPHDINVDESTPLLWVIRETVGLTGTKFGCGMAQCGACIIHLNGAPIRSCVTPLSAAANQEITTIEGLSTEMNAIQNAWIEEQVPQCGYCQSGQIMSATALLKENPNPTDDDIANAMNGNICRCGMYGRIKKGILRAADSLKTAKSDTV
ncbi:isoquinoline 1-oxidoreductase, alpha subunit [Spirosomataceae bacterium TFI 002]|nr:isoquinoline 1-oxidoreductase, alpha subunit [Spirosomataceae bacterium TFI 002]